MSDESEMTLRYGEKGRALRMKMAGIARLAVLRAPPFSSLAGESCLSPYEAIIRKRAEHEQKSYVDAFVGFMEFIVSDHVVRDEKALEAWNVINAEFQEQFAASYTPVDLQPTHISMGDSKKLIREEMRRRNASLLYERGTGGMLRFVRPAVGVEHLLVMFDMGSHGAGRFTPYVGTVGPNYFVELGSLLCLKKRSWMYSDAAECARAVNEVCDLLDLLIPVLDDTLGRSDALH